MNAPTPLARQVGWRPGDPLPLSRTWEVTAWRDPYGGNWRLGRDGVVIDPDGRVYRGGTSKAPIKALIEGPADDLPPHLRPFHPLVPCEVTSMVAVLREVEALRRTAEYIVGPEMCNERDCPDLEDEDGQPTGLPYCSHMERKVATAEESERLAAVERILNRLSIQAEMDLEESARGTWRKIEAAVNGPPEEE